MTELKLTKELKLLKHQIQEDGLLVRVIGEYVRYKQKDDLSLSGFANWLANESLDEDELEMYAPLKVKFNSPKKSI